MALNMKSLTQALAKTAAVIEQTVQSTVHEVTGPKALQDYELQEQVGSGGPSLVWKLYAAKHRNRSAAHNQDVCVWFLDKKSLTENRQRAGLSKAAEDSFLDIIRADIAQMVRLRHPGVLHVVQGLEENKAAMTVVTEPIFASVANVLGHLDNIANFPKGLKGLELGQLEIKHGLLQLAETFSFLHNNARLIHRALSPEAICITSSGAWKLAGFGFSVILDQTTTDSQSSGPAFYYPDYDSDDSLLPLQPSLNYIAPELTRSGAVARTSADIFSLGCIAYHLLSRQLLIDAKNNLRTYTNKVAYLKSESFSDIPPELVHDLHCMLNMDELSRPSALDFTGSSFFRDDTRLRAIRFLDHMLERDNMQKSDFLKALSRMWTGFDSRVLRYKVLPPLCAELRNVVMQPMVLPMVLTIAESQEKPDFESTTFPALAPVLASATGDSLLLLVKNASLFINKVNSDQLVTVVVPMLVRAYDDPDARMQEEVLRRTLPLAKQLDFQVVTQTILPRLHNLALKTTVAAVRVNALLCLGELVPRLDKVSVAEILKTLRRCTAVDHSAPTLMCTLNVAGVVYKQYGAEFAAEHLLPLLSPLLVAQQLNLQQFSKYMLFIKEILRKIEEKRGVILNEGDAIPQVGFQPKGSDGEQNGVESSSTIKGNSATWDSQTWNSTAKSDPVSIKASWGADDWSSVADSSTGSVIPTKELHSEGMGLSKGSSVSYNASGTSLPDKTNPSFEWPPSASQSSMKSQSINIASSLNMPMPNIGDQRGQSIDEFDPFADWPPRSNTSAGVSLMGSKSASLNQSSVSSLSMLNGGTIPIGGANRKNEIDISSFFSQGTAQPEAQPRKLAPPPAGLGKGQGRNPIRPIRSPQSTSKSGPINPPLMDLL